MRRTGVLLTCCAALSYGCSGAGSGSAGDSGTSSDATSVSDEGADSAPMPDGAPDVDATPGTDATTTDSGEVDSSADGGVDAMPGLDATTDGGSGDAGAEGGVDASLDVGLDAPADGSSTDAALDSGSGDTGSGDAGADSAPPPVNIVYAAGVTVSTLAGNGSYGDTDGQDASFANPTGIALYGSGGVIIVENDTGAIRVVSATGATTTLAKSPVQQAQTSPFTIVTGGQGYYYSTDFDQSGVHVDGGGGVWSFVLDDAGSGTSSLVAGGLYVPRTLVPLPGGDIFVFDDATNAWAPYTEAIAERLNLAGPSFSLIAGHQGQNGFANGDGGAALFGATTVGGVLLPDGSGVVVGDCSNSQLRLVALDGTVSTYAGSTTAGWVDGPVSTALFSCPHALAIDPSGNIYVSDWNNNAIRRLDVAGNVTTLAGTGVQGYADGAGNVAQFYGAEGLIVSADGSTLFVADGTQGNGAIPYNRIRTITLPAPDGG
jgi:sugar lactone lactonase YvrE